MKMPISHFFISIALLVAFSAVAQAVPMGHGSFSCVGNNGYKVNVRFTVDPSFDEIFVEWPGINETPGIWSMKMAAYDPSGYLIADYWQVIDGYSQYDGLVFHFNPKSGNILSSGLSCGIDSDGGGGILFDGSPNDGSFFLGQDLPTVIKPLDAASTFSFRYHIPDAGGGTLILMLGGLAGIGLLRACHGHAPV